MGEKEKMREEAEKLHKIQDPVSKNVPFPCNLEGTLFLFTFKNHFLLTYLLILKFCFFFNF